MREKKKKHSLSTWPSELYTQSPCIDPSVVLAPQNCAPLAPVGYLQPLKVFPAPPSRCFEDAKEAAQTQGGFSCDVAGCNQFELRLKRADAVVTIALKRQFQKNE